MSEEKTGYHTPVLFGESLNGLNIQPSGVYVDATFGGGGHARGILEHLGAKGKLYGFDQDADAQGNIPAADRRFVFVHSNFRYLSNFLRYHGESQIDGILADLGVSSHHFDDETRGFSFRFEGLLDMRMNKCTERTAATVLNTYPEEALANLFHTYGELRLARKLATQTVRARTLNPFRTIGDLLQTVRPLAGKEKEKKFLAQVFQALRMEVNDEIQALREMLEQALCVLKPGGRLVVISYHSLEDRLVKNFVRSGNFDGQNEPDFFGNRSHPFRLINNRVIVPSADETALNPRARSAKLRIAEKNSL
jgi:16S rRNA (cytosine1402-N4)-methyltransferase